MQELTAILIRILSFFDRHPALGNLLLLAATCFYVWETRRSRLEAVMPHVQVFFWWDRDGLSGQFIAISRNVGLGPALDVEYCYELRRANGDRAAGKGKYPVLRASEEDPDRTDLQAQDMNETAPVRVRVHYRDIFGRRHKQHFSYLLRELNRTPLPSDYARLTSEEKRRRLD